MQLGALLVSITALLTSVTVAATQIRVSRAGNSVQTLIGLFTEHRSHYLAESRHVVFNDAENWDLSQGLAGVPEEHRVQVRDLMWFYDNLGVLVAHGVVDIRPVSAYLGGSVLEMWVKLEPLVQAERRKRAVAGFSDSGRWQYYFEFLVKMAKFYTPSNYRKLPMYVRFRMSVSRWR
jgi:hypothetical protein